MAVTRPHGLTARELAWILPKIEQELRDLEVVDLATTESHDDLLVFFARPAGKVVLQVALGGTRSRVLLTRTRVPASDFRTGPRMDSLRTQLRGARFQQVVQPAGERRCSLVFRSPEGTRITIECELFGNRGLWCVLDAGGRIQHLSRVPISSSRELTPGAIYAPPRGLLTREDPAPRFVGMDLQQIDTWFSAQDQQEAAARERSSLQKWLDRRLRVLQAMIDGLETQAAAAASAPALRAEADLLLAYGHLWHRGASSLTLPDPTTGADIEVAVDPVKPIALQAKARYERARRLEDAVAVHEARRNEAIGRRAELEALAEGLSVAEDHALEGITAKAIPLGYRPDRQPPEPTRKTAQKHKVTARPQADLNFRRYTSHEGYPILVGRNNVQNDRLSLRVARGNDLWLHVGRGHAGSHVVVRLPKGKSAGLETLLDAGTLAIHFSKARASDLCDVIYTFAKYVRKPKGAAPGAVTVTQEKTLRIRLEKDRLARLLDSAPPEP